MLNRKLDNNTQANIAPSDTADYNYDRQAQDTGMPFPVPATPADLDTLQPYSPSVFLAGGDSTLNPNSLSFSEKTREPQDTNMEANVQSQSCDFVTSNLSAYLDGELDSAQTRTVGAHLGKCPRCSEILEALSNIDETIEREWRESAPLPSSFQFEQAVDNIMVALPSIPMEDVTFAAHRVHARMRWMRFATGLAGFVALLASLWSSYWLGYVNGRKSMAAFGSVAAGLENPSSGPSLRSAFASYATPHLVPASFAMPWPAITRQERHPRALSRFITPSTHPLAQPPAAVLH